MADGIAGAVVGTAAAIGRATMEFITKLLLVTHTPASRAGARSSLRNCDFSSVMGLGSRLAFYGRCRIGRQPGGRNQPRRLAAALLSPAALDMARPSRP